MLVFNRPLGTILSLLLAALITTQLSRYTVQVLPLTSGHDRDLPRGNAHTSKASRNGDGQHHQSLTKRNEIYDSNAIRGCLSVKMMKESDRLLDPQFTTEWLDYHEMRDWGWLRATSTVNEDESSSAASVLKALKVPQLYDRSWVKVVHEHVQDATNDGLFYPAMASLHQLTNMPDTVHRRTLPQHLQSSARNHPRCE
jgi:hypothetical protein